MRKLTKIPKRKEKAPNKSFQTDLNNLKKITFRCDIFLLEKVKNVLISQHSVSNYQYPNLSFFFRSAFHAYQHGMNLTYQRKNNPKKEISFRLDEELGNFYQHLPPRSRTEILERVLGSYVELEMG